MQPKYKTHKHWAYKPVKTAVLYLGWYQLDQAKTRLEEESTRNADIIIDRMYD